MHLFTHSYNILGTIDRGRFCDVKLVTECGGAISAHKVILSAVSKKLSLKFETSDSSEIKVRNVKIDTLTKVIDFVYNGKVKVSSSTEMTDFVDCYTLLNMYLGPKVTSEIRKLNNLNSESSEKGSQEEVFKCEECPKTFVSQKQLTRHRRQVHKEIKQDKVVYKCANCEKEYTVSHKHLLIIYNIKYFRLRGMPSTASAKLPKGKELRLSRRTV